jgi:putative Mg2+ transporter-C (MgtC) family protein
MSELQILAYMGVSIVLGGILGYDRERAEKPAGLRTHMLVAGAATLLTALGNVIVVEIEIRETTHSVTTDPIRILEAIVTAVGFLGAGTILRDRNKGEVEGLTTAASLLFTAGVGISVGLGKFILAVGVTFLGLLILWAAKIAIKSRINAPE